MHYPKLYTLFILAILFQACQSPESDSELKPNLPLFSLVLPTESGVSFTNDIVEDSYNNIWNFDYLYNGGGVAVGDFNNDNLPDLFFTGNLVDNKLYLNKGDFKFEDISENAGISAPNSWCSGVTLADVNTDGWLDIYICRSYLPNDENLRRNLLYINNGDNTFTDRAKEYGLDDIGFSTQATFLDYDLDGDLDLYLGNHPKDFGLSIAEKVSYFQKPPHNQSDHIYRNEGNGKFVDVTDEAGVRNYGFALGIVSADLNQDGWPDIYISNDYEEPDICYLNNGNGTFRNATYDAFKHLSNFGMGVDIADINNDGLLDISVLDMVAEDNFRQKTNMSAMAPERFWALVKYGFHYQYMRNSLQLNNGNGTFSEIGQFAGISNTDWSWANLLADFDNDGYKDLYITNGFRRDTRNVDAKKRIDKMIEAEGGAISKGKIQEVLELIPTEKLTNYLFLNQKDYTFSNHTSIEGMHEKSFSNGAAYADLDNDGDLDLVVNNLTDPAFIYRNNAIAKNGNHYLRIKLEGEQANVTGVGAKVTLKYGDHIQYQELTSSRGYLSAVENVFHFGLGNTELIESVKIEWPNRKIQILKDVKVDQVLTLNITKALPESNMNDVYTPQFQEITDQISLNARHVENDYDDYEKEILLPHKMSQHGPALATADVNGDGLDDFYLGGGLGSFGAIYLQQERGEYKKLSLGKVIDFGRKSGDDIDALFFDSDNDGDLDLYVVIGGNENPAGSKAYQDILYLNHNGTFLKSPVSLPAMPVSGGCVRAADYDNDGDLDLFVGGRQVPGKYPFPAASFILENDEGIFTDVTSKVAPELQVIGMVTSALWTDFNNDNQLDLMVAGEWMNIHLFENKNGTLTDISSENELGKFSGWWNSLAEGDFDGDGDMDYVAGNLGLNYKYKASQAEPFHVYCHDFDSSGSLDIVLGYFNQGKCFPLRGRQCSSQQMPDIKEKFTSYNDFASATLQDVYGENLVTALHYEANEFASVYIENLGAGKFNITRLPQEVQFAPVNAMLVGDFDADQNLDILLAGNLFVSEVETGRADAGIGLFLKGNGKGKFAVRKVMDTGFFAFGDVKRMCLSRGPQGTERVLVGNNNAAVQVFHCIQKKAVLN